MVSELPARRKRMSQDPAAAEPSSAPAGAPSGFSQPLADGGAGKADRSRGKLKLRAEAPSEAAEPSSRKEEADGAPADVHHAKKRRKHAHAAAAAGPGPGGAAAEAPPEAAEAPPGDAHPLANGAAAQAGGRARKHKRSAEGREAGAEQGPGREQAAGQPVDAHSRKRRRGVPPGAEQRRTRPTVTLALPGSVIENTQTLERATAVAGLVARTAAIFCIDEVVVIDDAPNVGEGQVSSAAAFLARVLQFMETPQYMRKALVPMHRDLRLAGQLPPLDAPHHMRADEWRPFREGVVVASAPGAGSRLDVGLDLAAHTAEALRLGARVTLRMGGAAARARQAAGPLGPACEAYLGAPVPPTEPRAATGVYWGYTVRLARGLSGMIAGCPFQGGYDLRIGTSERGSVQPAGALALPAFRHALVALGGPQGLEACLAADPAPPAAAAPDAFGRWLNVCPGQGSRTIRTEEAALIALTYLAPALAAAGGGAA